MRQSVPSLQWALAADAAAAVLRRAAHEAPPDLVPDQAAPAAQQPDAPTPTIGAVRASCPGNPFR